MTPGIALKFWKELYDTITDKFSGYEFNIQCAGLRIEHQPIGDDVWYTDKSGDGKFRLVIGEVPGYSNSIVISTWEIFQMKNCCGIAVSTRAEVTEKFRKIGMGTILNKIRIFQAKEDGYGLLLCTDCLENKAQQKVLNKNGWKCVEQFNNPRTGNKLGIHTINLSEYKF